MGVKGVSEAARDLGISKSAIRKAIRRGTIVATLVPGALHGDAYAIGEAEIARYKAAHNRPGHRVEAAK